MRQIYHRIFQVTGEPFQAMCQAYREACAEVDRRAYALVESRPDIETVRRHAIDATAHALVPKDPDAPAPPGWRRVKGSGSIPTRWLVALTRKGKEPTPEAAAAQALMDGLGRYPSVDPIALAMGCVPRSVSWRMPDGGRGSGSAGAGLQYSFAPIQVVWSADVLFIAGPETDGQIEEVLKHHPGAVIEKGRWPEAVPAGLKRLLWEEYELICAQHNAEEARRRAAFKVAGNV